MTQCSIYVGTNDNGTGKRMVSLGMMELATRSYGRVGFFRPIVRMSGGNDHSVAMMRSRYNITTPAEDMIGVTRPEARQLLAEDRYDELIQRIQQRFKAIEAECDFVLVEGTSYRGLAPELEFELNADIAVNLGCRVLSVYGMDSKTVDECVQSMQIGNDGFVDHGADLVATIVNQVPVEHSDELIAASSVAGIDSKVPLYLLPEEPLLRRPTLREIGAATGARLFSGEDSSLDREVAVLKVAAMQLPAFLERLADDALVICPGDRSDIIAGCILACSHPDFPSPAAIVMTGGIVPPAAIRRLIENSQALPMLISDDDTYTTAKKASKVRAEIGVHAPRKIESALGVFEQHIETEELARRLQAPAEQRITPMLFEYSLIQRARK